MTIFNVFSLLGGLALFLFGMDIMGKALEKQAGGQLQKILSKLTDNPLKGFFLGLCVTAVIQSSSATTVMVVGFVNSGIMELHQAIGVIMGSNVGTTVTSWILSLSGLQGDSLLVQLLKPTSFSPVLAFIGILLYMCKSEKKKGVGTILIGFAVLMTGMTTMSNAVLPLQNEAWFTSLFTRFSNPLLGVLVGALVTGIIQSSSASVGILQALSATGVITYGSAIPIIMGQNIGTCVTALISSVGASKNAKRAALIHLYFNIIGTVLFMVVFYAVNAVFPFAFMDSAANAAGIAVIHTTFNIIATAVLLPFSGTLEKLATLTVRDNDTVERIDDFQLLDERFLSNPAFAVEQCKVVTDRMAELTREAIFDAINLIDGGTYTQEMADRVEALETKIDRYEDKLGTYMVKLSRAKLSRKDGHTLSLLLHSISDFERISDHAVNLMDSVQEMHDKKMNVSSAAAGELHVFADAVRDIVNRSFDSFLHDDVKLAKTVEPLEACIDDINVNVKSRHIERLTTGQCTIELGFVLTDISTNFERVSDHCSNIAVYQIQVPKDEYDTHEYLQNVKHQEHAEFDREEMAYEKRYRLPDVARAQMAEAGE